MKKKSNAAATLIIILAAVVLTAFSCGAICGLVKLIAMCFR